MSTNTVPQVEYIGGKTPQESAALFNARIVELRFNNPSFERDGIGFWITYNKEIQGTGDEGIVKRDEGDYPRCAECPYFEKIDDKVKWGKCARYGNASVNINKRVCTSYWKNGGGESNA